MKVVARETVAQLDEDVEDAVNCQAQRKAKNVEVNGKPLGTLMAQMRSRALQVELQMDHGTLGCAAERTRRSPAEACVELQRMGAHGVEMIHSMFQADRNLVRQRLKMERNTLGLGLAVFPCLLPAGPCLCAEVRFQEKLNQACYYIVSNLGLYMIVEASRQPRKSAYTCNCCIEEGLSLYMKWHDVLEASTSEDKTALRIKGSVYNPVSNRKEKTEWLWFVQEKRACFELIRRRGTIPAPANGSVGATSSVLAANAVNAARRLNLINAAQSSPTVGNIVRVTSLGSDGASASAASAPVEQRFPERTEKPAPRRVFITCEGTNTVENILLEGRTALTDFQEMVGKALNITDMQRRKLYLCVKGMNREITDCSVLRTNDIVTVSDLLGKNQEEESDDEQIEVALS